MIFQTQCGIKKSSSKISNVHRLKSI